MRLLALITLCAALAGLVGCKQQQAALQPVKVRLAWVPDMAEAGIFVAREKGIYAREGLDVTIELGGFGLDPFKLVASGSSDIGVGGAGNLLLARDKGMKLFAFGAEFQNTPVGFMVREGSGINGFADFKGKRVGVQTGSDTDVLYRSLLASSGMKQSDIKEVPIQFDPTPFVSGAIDVLPGYVTNQPITLAAKGVKTRVITARSQGLSYYGNVYFAAEGTARDELLARFARATRTGWELAIKDKALTVAVMKKAAPDFSEADLGNIYDAVVPFILPEEKNAPLLAMDPSRWESTSAVLIKAGLRPAGSSTSGAWKDLR